MQGPSFCPTPSDINWHKCHLDWQAFFDRLRWADFFSDRNESNTFDTSGNKYDQLGLLVSRATSQSRLVQILCLKHFIYR